MSLEGFSSLMCYSMHFRLCCLVLFAYFSQGSLNWLARALLRRHSSEFSAECFQRSQPYLRLVRFLRLIDFWYRINSCSCVHMFRL